MKGADSNDFEMALRRILNEHGMDTLLDMPDFVLAEFMLRSLWNLKTAHTRSLDQASPIQRKAGLVPDWKILDWIEHNGMPPGLGGIVRSLVSDRIRSESQRVTSGGTAQ